MNRLPFRSLIPEFKIAIQKSKMGWAFGNRFRLVCVGCGEAQQQGNSIPYMA